MECGNRLKRNRAVATRYDKLAVRYEATVCIAAINEWLLPTMKHALATHHWLTSACPARTRRPLIMAGAIRMK